MSQIQKSGKLSNGWTDWHHIWHTSADPSGNRYKPNNCTSRNKGGTRGGFRCQPFKSLGKLSNGCTDWHQSWYTSEDSSGNGHRLNTIRPHYPRGISVFFRGSHIQMFREAVKRLNRLASTLVQICGFVWEWTYAK